MNWPLVPLSAVATPVDRSIVVEPDKRYRTIGVKLWGEGAYERETIDGAQTAARTLSLVRAGDLIINKIWVRHGSTAIASDTVDGCAASGEFPTFTLNPELVIPRWLHWMTKTRDFWHKCDQLSQGTSGKNRIKPEKFITIEIPLPPVAEQRRIVARVDAIASRVAEARRLREETANAEKALRLSCLEAFLATSVEPVPLGRLLEADSRISYGVLVPGPDLDEGIPFVRVQDLSIDHPPATPAKRIAPEIDSQYHRTRLHGGEVLVAVVGSIGKIGIAPPSWSGANIARAVCRIRPAANVDGKYLAAVLQSRGPQRYFFNQTRTLAQPTLNVGQLEQTPIPLPLLAEQRRIVAHLDALQAKLDAVRAEQAATAAELDALLPSVLNQAFAGKL